jgi:hypothetical protein
LRRISARRESGASIDPETSISSTVLPGSFGWPSPVLLSKARSIAFSNSGSHCGA